MIKTILEITETYLGEFSLKDKLLSILLLEDETDDNDLPSIITTTQKGKKL